MVDINSTITIIAINMNSLNTAIKNKYYHIRLGKKRGPNWMLSVRNIP